MNNAISQPKIYVAGHRGMAGAAIVRALKSQGYTNIITRTHNELDLIDQASVRAFFEQEKPDQVYLAAAKVGGIHANNTYPAEFIYDNLAIQSNVIHSAYENSVNRLLFLGSSCIYPRECPQPMAEEYLLTGPLESTNRPYAVAKIAGVEMCWSYNRQYGTKYIAAMPTNLYGVGDHYGLMNSHVIPAMIRKLHLAKMSMDSNLEAIIRDEACFGEIPPDIKEMLGLVPDEPISKNSSLKPANSISLWGSGTPRREFLCNNDMAQAVIYLMGLPDDEFNAVCTNNSAEPPLINIGFGKDITIRELAETVKEVVGYSGDLLFDATKPDGTKRKLLDVKRMSSFGWQAKVGLREGLTLAYEDLLARVAAHS